MKLKKEDIPFTMVANEVLKDKKLSFKAKGLYSYLFSKPNTWDFSGHRMIMETSDGKRAIFSALKELENNGYLSRERLSNGKMQYTLKHSIKSLVAETDTGVQKPSSRFAYKPKRLQAETATISNKEGTSNKEEKVIYTSGSPPPKEETFLKGNDWNGLIDSFSKVNPMYLEFYRNTTERAALDALAKTIGIEKLKSTILALSDITSQPYAPRITKPTELKRDLGKLIAFYNQQKNVEIKKRPKVIF